VDLLLIRHAEPVRMESAEGPVDPPLHERGWEQAGRLAQWLAVEPLDALVVSPLARARQTALPLAEAVGLTPVVEDGVAEWDRESREYIPVEELKAAQDDRWRAMLDGSDFAEIDGEAFGARVRASMSQIIEANPGRRVAVFCHGGVINHYLCDVLGIAPRLFFEPRYTSISRVAASRQGTRTVISLNETAHLRGLPGF